jgi:peptide subunit release factor 1 (eRF1)
MRDIDELQVALVVGRRSGPKSVVVAQTTGLEVSMLTDQDLHELLNFQSDHPVLSIYLNTEPSAGNAETHRLRLRSLLKEVDLPEDQNRVERYFEHEFDWSGRSVAVFSCTAEAFWRVYPLAVPTRSRVRVNERPYVKPLVDLVDSYGGYGVALVDKQGARLFSFHLGELREQEGVLGEAVHHTKRGGASAVPGRRGGVAGRTNHTEEVVERNVRDAAEFAAHFFSENNVRRILLCGTDENLALFRSFLPKAWQSLVVGAFPMSMTASHTEVLERAMQVGQEADRRREARLVDVLVTSAAKGKGGVIRLDDTLSAVHEGRVQTLLIQDGFRAAGLRCTSCGYITASILESCPYCGNGFVPIQDAVELAVREVMQTGGEVEVLHDDPTLAASGNIGGILRY